MTVAPTTSSMSSPVKASEQLRELRVEHPGCFPAYYGAIAKIDHEGWARMRETQLQSAQEGRWGAAVGYGLLGRVQRLVGTVVNVPRYGMGIGLEAIASVSSVAGSVLCCLGGCVHEQLDRDLAIGESEMSELSGDLCSGGAIPYCQMAGIDLFDGATDAVCLFPNVLAPELADALGQHKMNVEIAQWRSEAAPVLCMDARGPEL